MQIMKPCGKKCQSGFTLVEVLVVVAIIALLVSILLPSLNRAKELGRKVVCSKQQDNLLTATNLYHQDNNMCYPPVMKRLDNGDLNLWYEKEVLGKYFDENTGTIELSQGQAGQAPVPPQGSTLRCPSKAVSFSVKDGQTDDYSWQSYNITMVKEAFARRSSTPQPTTGGLDLTWSGPSIYQITSPSALVIFCDATKSRFWLLAPTDLPTNPMYWQLPDVRHLDGLNLATADGSVNWMLEEDKDAMCVAGNMTRYPYIEDE